MGYDYTNYFNGLLITPAWLLKIIIIKSNWYIIGIVPKSEYIIGETYANPLIHQAGVETTKRALLNTAQLANGRQFWPDSKGPLMGFEGGLFHYIYIYQTKEIELVK